MKLNLITDTFLLQEKYILILHEINICEQTKKDFRLDLIEYIHIFKLYIK